MLIAYLGAALEGQPGVNSRGRFPVQLYAEVVPPDRHEPLGARDR